VHRHLRHSDLCPKRKRWSSLTAVLRAFRYIPSFPGMFARWHTELVSHIHYVAIADGLEISWRSKNNLGKPELALFFQLIN
jgi:hypothetical protein